MNSQYRVALALAAVGGASIAWGIIELDSPPAIAMLLAAATLPIAIAFAVWGRIGGTFPTLAAIGGAIIGVPLTLLLGTLLYIGTLLSFAPLSGIVENLFEYLSLDPDLTGTLESEPVLLLIVALVLIAPLTEEFSKGVGGLLGSPTNRREAFLAGVAAGVGFAIVEDILYAAGGVWGGDPWPMVVLVRSLGAVVHPLATGVVMLGWWEWRENRDGWSLLQHFAVGAGIHAVWNGAIAVTIIAGFAFEFDAVGSSLPTLSLAYSAALGAIMSVGLWRLTSTVAESQPTTGIIDLTETRTLVVWIVLAASFMAPIAVLLLALPGST
ncbi:MAG: PrsW family glutamic-type intramembrane protease [Actinomycetota bacterium]